MFEYVCERTFARFPVICSAFLAFLRNKNTETELHRTRGIFLSCIRCRFGRDAVPCIFRLTFSHLPGITTKRGKVPQPFRSTRFASSHPMRTNLYKLCRLSPSLFLFRRRKDALLGGGFVRKIYEYELQFSRNTARYLYFIFAKQWGLHRLRIYDHV